MPATPRSTGSRPSVKLERDLRNPILTPRPEQRWECSATFNPGAIREADSIHILYRAVDDKGTSSFESEAGFATASR